MIKNMTRKGLAIGATAALTLAGLVGIAAPASATTGITVEPSKGTSYSMISGEQLDLRVFGQSNYTGGFSALKWEVSNADAATVTLMVPAGTSALAATRPATAASTPGATSDATSFVVVPQFIADATGANQLGLSVPVDTATTLQVRAFIDLNGNGTFEAGTDLSANVVNVTFVKPADVTTTTTITQPTQGDTSITASISFNGINNEQIVQSKVGAYFTRGDGELLTNTVAVTATETASETATYTADNNFVATRNVTIAGHNVTKYNGTYAAATVSPSNFTAVIAGAGDSTEAGPLTGVTATSAPLNVKTNATWSATESFKFTSDTVNALAKDTAVKVQPLFRAGGTPAAADTIGTAGTALVQALALNTIVANAVASTTAKAVSAGVADALVDSSFQVKATLRDASSTPKPVVGQAVTATVTVSGGVTLGTTASAKKVTVNGVTYTSNAKLPGTATTGDAAVALVSNASGEVVLNLATANFAANTDTITVTFKAQNKSSAVVTTVRAASYTAYVTNHRPDGSGDYAVDTTAGSSVALNVAVFDQFGGRPANDYDARAIWTSSNSRTTASTAATSQVVAIVGGNAVVTVPDNGTGTGNNVFNIRIDKRALGGGYVDPADPANGTSVLLNQDLTVHFVANASAGSLTVTDYTKSATTGLFNRTAGAGTYALAKTDDFGSYFTGAVLGTEPTVSGATSLAGTVRTAVSAIAPLNTLKSVPVTISGEGLQFRYTHASGVFIYAVGSITVPSDASGGWSVNIDSNKAGKHNVVVSAGSASETVVIDSFVPAEANEGDSVTIVAPASVAPGSTLAVTVKVTDEYGNPVQTDLGAGAAGANVVVSYDGPGLVVGSGVGEIASETNADGEVKFTVIMGSNDSGTATITARYRLSATANSDDDIVVQRTVNIGTAAAATTGKVNVGSFNGKLVVYALGLDGARISWKVAGRWGVATAQGNVLNRFDRPVGAAGRDVIVEIYVDRVLRMTKVVRTR